MWRRSAPCATAIGSPTLVAIGCASRWPTITAEHRLLAWREIEVELGEGTPRLARRIAKRLTDAGATPARYPSKLARVYRPAPDEPAVGAAAGQALMDYVTEQIDNIFDGDLGLRRGSDPIHDTRVAIRRLRSTLRVFGKLLDRDTIGGVEDELKW